MAYQNPTATAWDEVEITIAPVNTPDKSKMPAALTSVGFVKDGSFSLESQEGTTKQWLRSGGVLVDFAKDEPTNRVKFHVKNMTKEMVQRVFGASEVGDKLELKSLVSQGEYAIAITPVTLGAEILEIPRVRLEGALVYANDAGYGIDVTATILSPGQGKPLAYVSVKK